MAFNDYVTTKKRPPTKEVCPPVNFFQTQAQSWFPKTPQTDFLSFAEHEVESKKKLLDRFQNFCNLVETSKDARLNEAKRIFYDNIQKWITKYSGDRAHQSLILVLLNSMQRVKFLKNARPETKTLVLLCFLTLYNDVFRFLTASRLPPSFDLKADPERMQVEWNKILQHVVEKAEKGRKVCSGVPPKYLGF